MSEAAQSMMARSDTIALRRGAEFLHSLDDARHVSWPSVGLQACELHHLGPLLGFVGEEFTVGGGRPTEHRGA